MKPERLVGELKKAAADRLRAVILYGSAAAGDSVGKKSDFNILVVTTEMGQSTLEAFAEPARAWQRAGNPAPLLFTEERLEDATDVFPIELLDIKDCHKILHGEDLVEDLEINTSNLRLEIEHELRGKLIQLRQRYLIAAGKRRKVVELMENSIGTFLVLFHAALRLFEAEVPSKKLDALELLAKHIDFDTEVFKTVQGMKAGDIDAKGQDVEQLFGNYLSAIESVIDDVDRFIKEGEKI